MKRKILISAISFLAGAIVATSGFCVYTAVKKNDCCNNNSAGYSQNADGGNKTNDNNRFAPPDMPNGQNGQNNQNNMPPQMPGNGQQNSGSGSNDLPELPSGSQNGQTGQMPQAPGNNS